MSYESGIYIKLTIVLVGVVQRNRISCKHRGFVIYVVCIPNFLSHIICSVRSCCVVFWHLAKIVSAADPLDCWVWNGVEMHTTVGSTYILTRVETQMENGDALHLHPVALKAALYS